MRRDGEMMEASYYSLMNKPIVGTLSSSLDGNRCWYNFLYPDGVEFDGGTDFIDLSYLNINAISLFTVYDWVERCDG